MEPVVEAPVAPPVAPSAPAPPQMGNGGVLGINANQIVHIILPHI